MVTRNVWRFEKLSLTVCSLDASINCKTWIRKKIIVGICDVHKYTSWYDPVTLAKKNIWLYKALSLCIDIILSHFCFSERHLEAENILLTEPVSELGHIEYQLLKFFILLYVLISNPLHSSMLGNVWMFLGH